MSASRRGRASDPTAHLSLDISVPPSKALEQLAGAINQPRRRFLGVIKTRPEFVGHIDGRGFEVWERRRRAVHALGSVEPRGRGTRVRVRFDLSRVARVGVATFFAVYAVAMLAIAFGRAGGPSVADLGVGLVGAILMALIFVNAARRQRRELRAFLERALPRR